VSKTSIVRAELMSDAAQSGKPIPKQSNVYEEIVKKGWGQVKKRQ
jgi:hypothetical protein